MGGKRKLMKKEKMMYQTGGESDAKKAARKNVVKDINITTDMTKEKKFRKKAKKRNIWEEAMNEQKAFYQQMVERNKNKEQLYLEAMQKMLATKEE